MNITSYRLFQEMKVILTLDLINYIQQMISSQRLLNVKNLNVENKQINIMTITITIMTIKITTSIVITLQLCNMLNQPKH